MLAFAKLGYNVLIPYGDCERYDFIVDTGTKFIKIQSKTSRSNDDGASFSFSGRSCNRQNGKIVHNKYTSNEIDYFATSFDSQCYLVPVDECGSDKRLRLKPAQNEQIRGVTWAKDYKLEEMIKNW